MNENPKRHKLPNVFYRSLKYHAHLLHGDCVEVMREMISDERGFKGRIDAIVTDPPYGIDWLASDWDEYDHRSQEQKTADSETGDSCEKVMFKKMSVRQEAMPSTAADAGLSFQKWCEEWGRLCYALLKPGGYILSFGGSRAHHRMVCGLEDAGFEVRDEIQWVYSTGAVRGRDLGRDIQSVGGLKPDEMERLKGKNTALKPAHEPITVQRKPLPAGQSVTTCVATTGVGAMNVKDTRFPSFEERLKKAGPAPPVDRYPANVVVAEDEAVMGEYTKFFYCPKPSVQERGGSIGGLGGEKFKADWDAGRDIDAHPTTKPIRLMSWLVTLVTPPGGIVLDPFMGSGTTVRAAVLGGFRGIGIEKEEPFANLAKRRLQELEAELDKQGKEEIQ